MNVLKDNAAEYSEVYLESRHQTSTMELSSRKHFNNKDIMQCNDRLLCCNFYY